MRNEYNRQPNSSGFDKCEKMIEEAISQCSPRSKIEAARIRGYKNLLCLMDEYFTLGFTQKLLIPICEKKLAFIKDATSEKQIKKILWVFDDMCETPKKVLPKKKYQINEEKLIVLLKMEEKHPDSRTLANQAMELCEAVVYGG